MIALVWIGVTAISPGLAFANRESTYDEYRATGVVQGCDYSAEELRAALDDIPPDIRAYDPGFADALNAALEQGAAACSGDLPRFPAALAGVFG